jgi:RNA:NAD 2'-phosphotransferase (TPT1/KptA family)
MTPAEALQVLSEATEPQNVSRITRAGYVRIEQALVCLSDLVTARPNATVKADKADAS